MPTTQAERPSFYQGQYLGPEDLDSAVDHSRWARARHDLGAHAWGIAIGLELRELPALGGGVEVFVEPGYAVDGFGRPLVLGSAREVAAEALGRLSVSPQPGSTSLLVPVWLRYTEQRTREPAFGFEVCETDDQRARIAEGVEVLVGARTLAEQRDRIVIAGDELDAVEALRTADPQAPLLCDGSVPFQTFPADAERWWLVPLGVVRWQPGSPGQLLAMSEPDRRESRRRRHYVGAVAEGLYAADGLIRLRSRHRSPAPGAVGPDAVCSDVWPRAQSELDLRSHPESGRITPTELVWVEGDLRVAGDTRLFGGKLELRDEHGDDHDVPMWLRRVESNSYLAAPGNPVSGRDLEVLIGRTSDEDGRNRLVIGAAPPEGEAVVTGRVVVQNDGRVGIGTLDPPTDLRSPLTIRAVGGGEELLGFEAPDGTKKWHLNQNLAGSANGLNFAETGVRDGRLFLQSGGRVGLGTTDPQARLEIAGAPANAGALWLRVGDGGDSGRVWIEYGPQLAPLLVLSDLDDPPRLRFQQVGGGSEASPAHSSWFGHAGGNSPDLAIVGGRLGIGTQAPARALHVQGDRIRLESGGKRIDLRADGSAVDLHSETNNLYLRSSGAGGNNHILMNPFAADGNVGIGTQTPTAKLDVRGSVRLGAAGELFALGAAANLRVIAGRVNASAAAVNPVGFSAARAPGAPTGRYRVTFATAFAAVPVVVASPVDVANGDRLLTIRNLTTSRFDVDCVDVAPPGEGTLQNTAFTFLALGTRP
jgi:hypothetical protein